MCPWDGGLRSVRRPARSAMPACKTRESDVMNVQLCKLLPAVLVAGWLIGCAQTSEDRFSPPPRLVKSQVLYIEDVPLPNGFTKLDKSYGSSTGTIRNYVHYYEGQARRVSVLKFYQSEMPKYGWVELTLQDVDDAYTLRYEKADEHCEILITDDGKKAKVRVVIQPVRRWSAKPEEPET
jgi:hypothetical protein